MQLQDISCPEAKEVLENGGQLVDVRTAPEHQQGTIENSIHLPLQDIYGAQNVLDDKKPIIVYCRSGARSAQAKMILNSMGYRYVHNLGAINNINSC
ncbi:MAG: rhodanese-like domain-containing protein [Gammaproteobacteria bacterium]|nr:MAG: rhodanese-like domain-containing protein [Gammaproteobacteria bacterium]